MERLLERREDPPGVRLRLPATAELAPGLDRDVREPPAAELLCRPGGGAVRPLSEEVLRDRSYFIKMAGREVFKSAVLAMAEACDEALRRAGVTADEIDLLVPHQANIRIIEATAKHAGLPMSKVMVNVDRYGNTSSASIPLALEQARAEGRLREGTLVMLVAFGAGFTWGSTVIRW